MMRHRLLKNAHLRRYPARSPSRGRAKSKVGDAYMRPLQGASGALHLSILDQPVKNEFSTRPT